MDGIEQQSLYRPWAFMAWNDWREEESAGVKLGPLTVALWRWGAHRFLTVCWKCRPIWEPSWKA